MSNRKTERELEIEIETIATTLERSGAVLPLVIWSAGVRDLVDGVPQGMGSVSRGHRGGSFSSYREAAERYLDLADPNGEDDFGVDVFVVKPERIIDATGAQVYPKP